MKINKINIYPIVVPTDFTYANGKKAEYPMAAIELISGKHHAWGEADLRADLDASKLTELAATLLDREIDGPDSALDAIVTDLGHYNHFTLAREGLNIALYDLFGKILNVNASVLLGGLRRKEIPGMPVVFVASPGKMAKIAKKWTDAGYKFLKIKYRGNREEDLEALKTIRKSIGENVRLQVDPNFSYANTEESVEAINDMEPYNVEVVEDVHDGDWKSLCEIRKNVKPKIMIDYEAYWPNVLNVVKNNAADIINIHPKNQGGLDIALKVHAVTQAAGLETAIGSMYLLGIGNSAFQLLAGVIGGDRPCEDISFCTYLNGPASEEYDVPKDATVVTPFPIIGGKITIVEQPGLGIEINRKKVEDNCSKIIEL